MNVPAQATAIAVAALDLCPPQLDVRHQASKKLVGIGLVSHHFHADGSVKLRLRTNDIGLLSMEEHLLDWLEDELTGCELLVAVALADTFTLLRAEMQIDRHLGLTELLDAPPARLCDLAKRRWHGGRQPFVDTCRATGVPVRPNAAVDVRANWITSRTRPMQDHLANRAAAGWRVWASRQPGNDSPAIREALDKLDIWLTECVAPPATSADLHR